MFSDVGKSIIFVGVALILVGLLFTYGDKIPFLGKLPGDILIKKGSFTFFAPIATSIIVSLLLTLILNLIFRYKK